MADELQTLETLIQAPTQNEEKSLKLQQKFVSLMAKLAQKELKQQKFERKREKLLARERNASDNKVYVNHDPVSFIARLFFLI